MNDIDYTKVRGILLTDGEWHSGRELGIELFEREGEQWFSQRASDKAGRDVTVTGPVANVLAFEIID
jgi:hypothetical protein